MVYAFPGAGALDYFGCHYGTSRLLFRGPQRPTDGDFIACLGGSETYGKYIPQPFADLVEGMLDMPVVNLGCANAGPDVYLADEGVTALAARARAVVVQICGAQNLTNRYYAVHPRRNDRFLGATALLRSLFRDIDFTEFSFTRHMLTSLQAASPDRFEVVAEELRAAWVARMRLLLSRLPGPVVLLWMADVPPPSPARRADLTHAPLLVDAEMVAALKPQATTLLEVLPSAEARAAGTEGMAFGPLEGPAAANLPGPRHHAEVAARLAAVLAPLVGGVTKPSSG